MIKKFGSELKLFKESLMKGVEVVKHGRAGNPKSVTIFSEDSGQTIHYQPTSNFGGLTAIEGKSIRVVHIREIKAGLQTPALERCTNLLLSNKCFAVIHGKPPKPKKYGGAPNSKSVGKGPKKGKIAVAASLKGCKAFNIEALDYASYKSLIIGFKLLKAESLYVHVAVPVPGDS